MSELHETVHYLIEKVASVSADEGRLRERIATMEAAQGREDKVAGMVLEQANRDLKECRSTLSEVTRVERANRPKMKEFQFAITELLGVIERNPTCKKALRFQTARVKAAVEGWYVHTVQF